MSKELTNLAVDYLRAGLSVVPVRTDGRKSPVGQWKHLRDVAPMSELEAYKAFAGDVGIGICCGKTSGNLEVIDFDVRPAATYKRYRELVAKANPTLLKRLVKVQTPSGGFHLYYRCHDTSGNQKLAFTKSPVKDPYDTSKLKDVLIETRGSTGYVVAPGSPPKTHLANKPYKWHSTQGDFTKIPLITPEERSVLLNAARALNERVELAKVPQQPSRAQAEQDPESPSAKFNATQSWANILEPHGWTVSFEDGDVTYWCRPGKTIGISATTGYCGDLFYVFSTSADPFTAERAYTKFAAWATLNYGADYSTASTAVYLETTDAGPNIDDTSTKTTPTPRVSQEKLLALFLAHNTKLVLLRDTDYNYRWFWRTEHTAGSTYEVIELLQKDDRRRAIKKVLDSIGKKRYTTGHINTLYEYINVSSDLFTKAPLRYIAEASPPNTSPTYTFKLTPPIPSADTRSSLKAWEEWLSRCHDPEAFAAWVWSIYEPKHRGRQLLYLWGKGEDGKSTIIRVIRRNIGNRYCASVTNTGIFANGDKHGTSSLVGKRLIALPDVTNENLLKYPKMKSILGGDHITIEPKNMTAFSTVLDTRVLACANEELNLSKENWESSRLLMLQVDSPPDANKTVGWETELDKEFSLFLQYAKHCYTKHCPKHYEIISKASNRIKNQLAQDAEEDLLAKIEAVFDLDTPGNNAYFMPRSDFSKELNRIGIRSGREIKEVKSLLVSRGYTDFNTPNGFRQNVNGRLVKGYRDIRIKTL